LLPLQANGKQVRLAGGRHWPLALHVDGGVYAPLTHFSPAQTVSGGYAWHDPFPSHLPLVAQEPAPMSLHLACGSTRPAPTLLQWPGAFFSPQVWQAPAQALSQQTPSTQKLDWHSPAT